MSVATRLDYMAIDMYKWLLTRSPLVQTPFYPDENITKQYYSNDLYNAKLEIVVLNLANKKKVHHERKYLNSSTGGVQNLCEPSIGTGG